MCRKYPFMYFRSIYHSKKEKVMFISLRRRPVIDKYTCYAFVIVISACLLRVFLIAQGWPAVTDDEGPVGLMARHIAYLGAHPLFYYGQDYMGPLEAYLGAAFFWLFGPSAFSLRLGLIVLFALFLACFYFLTTLLYSKALALFSLVLLGLGTPEVVFRQLQAAGGPPDYAFFVTLLLLLTFWLAFTSHTNVQRREVEGISDSRTSTKTRSGKLSRRRLVAYAAWGVIAGLAIWSHLLCLPFVGVATLMLFLCCYRELRLPVVALLLLMVFLCASPQLLYKFFAPTSTTQASLFGGGYHESGGAAPLALTTKEPAIQPSFGLQIMGNVMVTLPIAINANGLCTLNGGDAWPLTPRSTPHTLVCSGIHGIWGIGFIVLWFIAAIGAAHRFWKLRKQLLGPEYSSEQRREMVRQAAHLTLLLGAGGTEFIISLNQLANAVTPWTSSRYLIGLLLVTPAVLYPLWENRQSVKAWQNSWKASFIIIAKSTVLVLILLCCLLGTLNIFTQEVATAQFSMLRDQQLIEQLTTMKATRIYTDNWMCDRIAFESNEQIICSVLDQHLRPGLDRYFPYRAEVNQAPQPFYVFPQSSAQALLMKKVVQEQHIACVTFKLNKYIIYELAQ